jgi:cobalt-zinc-cadmium efflux system membrane fusion protein
MHAATILVVDDDEVLLRVLTRVLAREGHAILPAASSAQALELAGEHAPRLALLDLSLKDGDGMDLARELRARRPGLPLIVMTGQPWLMDEHPEQRNLLQRVLTKPVNLADLRQAVNASLDEEPMRESTTPLPPDPEVTTPASVPPALPAARKGPVRVPVQVLKVATLTVLGLGMAAGAAVFLGLVPPFWKSASAETTSSTPAARTALAVELVSELPHTLRVPESVRKCLGIHNGKEDLVAVARRPTQSQSLVLPGSTALDPAQLWRIRARFAPARVVEIARVRDEQAGLRAKRTVMRELRPGDRVQKGDLLGVFYSVDVGNKKNDLIDALVQLKLDEKIHDEAMKATGAVPPVFMWSALRAVEGDRNAVARAESTLLTWDIPEEDMEAVRKEAEEISKRQGKRDKSKDGLWPRVELRAPEDGVIVERNVVRSEMVVDNTVNLFQIAKVDRLTVKADAPEDDLPILLALTDEQRVWRVHTVGATAARGIDGTIDEIGVLLDPNQHTAVIKGYIDNPREQIRAGQFVTATVLLPPPAGVVEVPIDAVVEDGKYCVVFVQTDPVNHLYTMRRVQVTHRFEKTAFVRSTPIPREEQLTPEEQELGLLPREPLHPGERLAMSGVGELKAALLDLESRPAGETKAGKDK